MTGGPWPERHGLRCRVVTDSHGGPFYPWAGMGKHEVVVLIEDDPHRHDIHFGISNDPTWSCVLERRHLTAL